MTVDSQGGRAERFYGKLGETVKEIKTIASATQGNSANGNNGGPEVWTTEYLFDSFGRLQRLAYPDGEILSYGYDAGGNVAFAQVNIWGQTRHMSYFRYGASFSLFRSRGAAAS